MELLFWFSVGFISHRVFHALKNHFDRPYKWVCPEENCNFRVSSSSPDALAHFTLVHQNASHRV